MDIGIITLWASNNYGGVLQAYATQTYLEQLGHRAFVVPAEYDRKKANWLKTLERPVKRVVDLLKARKFRAFRSQHLRTGGLSSCGVRDYLDKGIQVDALVCGSDQVWSPGICSQADLRQFFFLNFGSPTMKRIAYAASWGTAALDPAIKDEVATYLKRFNSVSVREKSGQAIAGEVGCSAAWLPDPTLLLDAASWHKLADTAERTLQPETLFQCEYRWTPSIPFARVVQPLTRKYGLRPVIPFSNHVIRDVAHTKCLSPTEWINGIRKSSFVVTNSFHGMVFSIIFKRPFLVIPLSGKYMGMNERFFSLAGRLGLEDRILQESDPAHISSLADRPINWDEVEVRVGSWREEACAFMTSALI